MMKGGGVISSSVFRSGARSSPAPLHPAPSFSSFLSFLYPSESFAFLHSFGFHCILSSLLLISFPLYFLFLSIFSSSALSFFLFFLRFSHSYFLSLPFFLSPLFSLFLLPFPPSMLLLSSMPFVLTHTFLYSLFFYSLNLFIPTSLALLLLHPPPPPLAFLSFLPTMTPVGVALPSLT